MSSLVEQDVRNPLPSVPAVSNADLHTSSQAFRGHLVEAAVGEKVVEAAVGEKVVGEKVGAAVQGTGVGTERNTSTWSCNMYNKEQARGSEMTVGSAKYTTGSMYATFSSAATM
ncbi:hypothetical protein FRACYDRAFT_246075 [Fragilariopsis cylindrus CCMP1102]|uniref:Uncharacterized protein n=1 Tax=Fragilariopsis cylindrus CCMP1102 TaxID=635003 RepID=A0A1E7EYQ9_9STRA|nr:hypothetical protein FRACYDRAFT_246075 [Fragilariopsis cylindrus CCMP1102]|eukprot:OEU10974.1 hypothetical protein FRACYDRAFT_246075 [Fragilariopsis cylindrus CCMP1102]